MIEIDKTSLLVSADTDYSIKEIEGHLGKEGFTLNYFGIPDNEILLVDVLNDRVPNLYGEVYGGMEDLCVQVKLARTDGTVYQNRLAPRSATGPSLKKICIGAQESLGIPIQATLKIFYQPECTEIACILFPGQRQMEYFLQAVQKFKLPVPLLCPLSQKYIQKFFEGFGKESTVLGLVQWGEKEVVENNFAYLQELASLKQGEWVEVEKGKIKLQLLEALHRESAIALQKVLTATEAKISPTHLKLMKLIKGIA